MSSPIDEETMAAAGVAAVIAVVRLELIARVEMVVREEDVESGRVVGTADPFLELELEAVAEADFLVTGNDAGETEDCLPVVDIAACCAACC